MQKIILYGEDARGKVKEGADKVCNVAKVTLGPKGRNVLIKRSRISPYGHGVEHMPTFSSRDGVEVVRSITLDDSIENVGADLVKEAAERTMFTAGDNTTSTCIYFQSIVGQGIELINNKCNVQELKSGIDEGVKNIVNELRNLSNPVDDDMLKLRDVATISANNDAVIGELIYQGFKKMGKDGIINIENSKTEKTEIKILDGLTIGKGFESPYFITNQSNGECELENPFILLYGKRITTLAQIEGIIKQVYEPHKLQDGSRVTNGNSMLIICESIDGEALAFLSMNAGSGQLKICAIQIPETGELKTESMEDLAIMTGGTYIIDEKGTSLKGVTLNSLGRVPKIVVNKKETVIIVDQGKTEIIEFLNKLKNNLQNADADVKVSIEKRISKLTGGVATLYVGGATNIEAIEKKARVDDAVRATKCAVQEGWVTGGCISFMKASLKTKIKGDNLTDFEKGQQIINNAILAPFFQLCENGSVDAEDIYSKIVKSEYELGYNAKTNKIENLNESGVIESFLSNRCALENGASAAIQLLLCNALICDSI